MPSDVSIKLRIDQQEYSPALDTAGFVIKTSRPDVVALGSIDVITIHPGITATVFVDYVNAWVSKFFVCRLCLLFSERFFQTNHFKLTCSDQKSLLRK